MPLRIRLLWLLIVLNLMACARLPWKSPEDSLVATSSPRLTDDLNKQGLIDGLKNQIRYLRSTSKNSPLPFANRQIPREKYADALDALVSKAESATDGKEILDFIESHFDFYSVYGDPRLGEVFLTSYYEPVIYGSPKKTVEFSEPLYSLPNDLVEIQIEKFDRRFQNIRTMRGRILSSKSPSGLVRIGPYFSRKEINQGALNNKKLELVWVNPLDAFFLQIQGSGTVLLPDKTELRIGYAEQNGYLYEPIGKYMIDKIPLEEMTLHSIEKEIRNLSLAEQQELLQKNQSYVFFRKLEGAPITSINTPVTEGRTIATDLAYFPKGTLCFLEFEKPVFKDPSHTEADEWKKNGRFVLDQDTGGAIRGPGRVDLFWGRGNLAKQAAGVIKQTAKLYYLAPKETFFH